MGTPSRQERHANSSTWSASGPINLELAPKNYAITRLGIEVRLSITTTLQTLFSDYYDRAVTNLSLSGMGRNFFNFTNMRAAAHFNRLRGCGMGRPTVIADNQTTLVQHIYYLFHFGVKPTLNGEDNPFDLTGGIPPVASGNLTLQGTWGAATAMGTNCTIAAGSMHVYLWGVVGGQPIMLPEWSMATPTPTATSSAFATAYSIPSGNFLRSLLVMETNGTNAPRDDSVLNSIKLYNSKEGQTLLSYGGQAGAVADYKAAEAFQQFSTRARYVPPSENVTTAMTGVLTGGSPGVPDITHAIDSGLVPIYLYQFQGAHPQYGIDLQKNAAGDYQLQWGVSDATGVTVDVVHEKYAPNAAHPMGAALLRR
ncbi:MAG: hypothetical protein M1401_20695 [Chloroflexi bacterium]|nr:hypothetical protein [Chloroflexota bacterium]